MTGQASFRVRALRLSIWAMGALIQGVAAAVATVDIQVDVAPSCEEPQSSRTISRGPCREEDRSWRRVVAWRCAIANGRSEPESPEIVMRPPGSERQDRESHTKGLNVATESWISRRIKGSVQDKTPIHAFPREAEQQGKPRYRKRARGAMTLPFRPVGLPVTDKKLYCSRACRAGTMHYDQLLTPDSW